MYRTLHVLAAVAASYHDRGNGLYVDGRLRVNGNTASVYCTAARGSRERELTMKIDETGG
ncbi:hypothetical protein EBA05_20995 [Xanthomonas oryzae pv. oryzae]|nr:hypothetical protein AXO1947_01525 [Xanthomonas oryzae pv. oryzae]AVU04314.1 hypothetical protein C0L90_20945 [Xanthomonas oryzae pv. oryzae]QBN23577.1 hypothetical protein EBA00_01665 [Xanthomonas oryzae pv. oryzae]QBN44474.1 hypothetical protein EBA05_20995 [Xanthomonas oryzae pv. oryzae]QBN77223.1 hypothetical protein EBA14_21025 [Xanthomonas oryzae pv. oryzae]